MHELTPYIVSGLVLGSIYAITASSIVLTYKSSRVFNFAQGAIAFFVARLFYQLVQRSGWSGPAAGAVCVLVVAPALGLVLWAVLFRYLDRASTQVRLVSTIGLYVALPAVTQLIFGATGTTLNVVGLTGRQPSVYHIV